MIKLREHVFIILTIITLVFFWKTCLEVSGWAKASRLNLENELMLSNQYEIRRTKNYLGEDYYKDLLVNIDEADETPA